MKFHYLFVQYQESLKKALSNFNKFTSLLVLITNSLTLIVKRFVERVEKKCKKNEQ